METEFTVSCMINMIVWENIYEDYCMYYDHNTSMGSIADN